MVGCRGEPGHGRIQERARRLRDGLEDLPVQGPEPFADLPDTSMSHETHGFNVAADDDG
jgi:hypothetical protein